MAEKFNAVPFEDLNGTKQARYYQELAVNNVMAAIANDEKTCTADAGNRYRQDLHRVSNCMEAVQKPMEQAA